MTTTQRQQTGQAFVVTLRNQSRRQIHRLVEGCMDEQQARQKAVELYGRSPYDCRNVWRAVFANPVATSSN